MKADRLVWALASALAFTSIGHGQKARTTNDEAWVGSIITNAIPGFDPFNPFKEVPFEQQPPKWEDTTPADLPTAQREYQERARTNHITLDKPQYTNAPWSEIRLRTAALNGDGLAASLCSGSNDLHELFWLSLAATNGWLPSQVELAKNYEYERQKGTSPGELPWEGFMRGLGEIQKQPKAARQAAAQFWWSKAKAGLPKLKVDAVHNHAQALYALGLLHQSGDLVESNAVLAAELFHKAAESGLAPAQEAWGSHCDWHLTNQVEAVGWYYCITSHPNGVSTLDSNPKRAKGRVGLSREPVSRLRVSRPIGPVTSWANFT
jgi:TPR repeat protein